MRRRALFPLIAGLVALAFALSAACCMRQLIPYEDCLSVRIPDTPVSQKALTEALPEASGFALCAAWTRTPAQSAVSPTMQTETKLAVVRVYGDMRQTAPMTLLCGSFPVEDDKSGCLLSADVAMTLFRSVDAVGARLSVGEKTFAVRGVIACGEPQLLVRGDQTAAYENLEFTVADRSSGRAAVAAFLYRYALTNEPLFVESGLYARILQSAALVPWLLSFSALLVALLRGAWSARRKLWPLLWRVALSALLVTLLALLIRRFYWPQSFLPTKLSDFTFWQTLGERWSADWAALRLMTPLTKDVTFFRIMRQSLFLLFASLLCMLGALGFLGARRA